MKVLIMVVILLATGFAISQWQLDRCLDLVDRVSFTNDSLVTEIIKLRKTIHFKDSIYRDHLSQCSYVRNDQFEITKDRYLKVRKPSRTIH
jgi:hypothetical protein